MKLNMIRVRGDIKMKKIIMMIITASILSMLMIEVTSSWNVTIVWEKNSESDLAGYRVFMRKIDEEYDYTNPALDVDTNVAMLSGIPDGEYAWVVRAYDVFDTESANSNEVEELLNLPPAGPAGCRILNITP